MHLRLFQYNIISYALLLPALLNLFLWESSFLATVTGGLFLFFQSLITGKTLESHRTTFIQILYGLFVLTLYLMIVGTVIYMFVNLSTAMIALIFLTIPLFVSTLIAVYGLEKQGTLELPYQNLLRILTEKRPVIFLITAYIALSSWLYKILIQARTTEAITSPWDVVPAHFWLLFFVSTTIILIILQSQKSSILSFFLSIHHLFFTSSIVLIIYQLGFGFDPFIHQTTEQLIASEGVVLPKTPYYIGQYSLVVLLHKLVGGSIVIIDRLLFPLLFSIGVPLFFYMGIHDSKHHKIETTLGWLPLLVLVIPFSLLLMTTPQSIASTLFILLMIAVFTSLLSRHYWLPDWVLFAIALAALFTHPLVGLPAFLLFVLSLIEKYRDQVAVHPVIHKIVLLIITIAGSISLPILFLLNSSLSKEFTTSLKKISEIDLSLFLSWLPIRLVPTEAQYRDFFFEFGYFFNQNIWWIMTIFVFIASYWLLIRSKHEYFRVFVLLAFILFMNAALVSSALDFPELIQYESTQYAQRLFTSAYWALLPLVLIGFIWAKRIVEHSPLYQWCFTLCLAALITGSLFSSYPRNNRYELGRQYSVSAADILTVNKIAEDKNGYIVLANQSVSAAAIQEHGFKTYYQTEDGKSLFYYPIPTSSPLYDVYLNMVYNTPSRENAAQAIALSGDEVDTVYFVLNAYWDNAQQISEQAKLTADKWVEIDNGTTTIFVYEF